MRRFLNFSECLDGCPTMNRSILIPLILAAMLLCSCGSSVQHVKARPDVRLRDYNKLIAYLTSASGSVSASTATLGKIGSAQISSGASQGVRALESLQFELMAIGFNFVSSENEANAIVEFTIGDIRYDPLAGWIADQALVKFKNAKTGEVLAFFRANSQFITPTVDNIVGNLADAIRDSY